MLVGGTTSYDANDQALLAIVNQLAAQRAPMVPRGRAPMPGNLTGSYGLVVGKTVVDPGTHDSLFAGKGINWFVPGAHDTVVK